MDQTKLGTLVQELMEKNEERHSEDAKIGDACIIAEVFDSGRSSLVIRTTPMPVHHSTGLLVMALDEWSKQGDERRTIDP